MSSSVVDVKIFNLLLELVENSVKNEPCWILLSKQMLARSLPTLHYVLLKAFVNKINLQRPLQSLVLQR